MKRFIIFFFSFFMFIYMDIDSFASDSLRLKYHHYNDNLIDGAFNYDLYTRFDIPKTTLSGWETVKNLTGNLDTVGFLKDNHRYVVYVGGLEDDFRFYHEIDYITGNTGGTDVRNLYIPFVNEMYLTVDGNRLNGSGAVEFVYDSSMGDFPIQLHASYGIANNYNNDYELEAFCISGFVYNILIEDLGPVSSGDSSGTGGDSSDSGNIIDYRPNLERIEEGLGVIDNEISAGNNKLSDIELDIQESNEKLGDIDKSINDFNSDYRTEIERQKNIDNQIGGSSDRMKDDLEKFQDDLGGSEGVLVDEHMGSLKDLSFSDGFTDLFNNLTFPLAATASLLTALFNVWETDSIFTFSFILLIISIIIGMRKFWR